MSREMHLWRLAGERIAERVVFSAGRWDVGLVARMAAEAPTVRPATASPRVSAEADTRAAIARFDDTLRPA